MVTSLVIEVLIVRANRSVLDRAAAVKTAPAKSAPAIPVPALPAAPAKK